MSLDITAAQKALKEVYPNGLIEIDFKTSKTAALLKKSKGTLVETPFGAGFAEPIKYGNPQAQSATYATGYAQAATAKTLYNRWFLKPAEFFGFARVAGSLVRRSAGVGSFINAMTSEIENAKKGMTRSLEIALGRGGWGNVAQISTASTVNTTTITLAQPWMVRMLEIGQSLVASESVDGADLRSATALTVAKRHLDAGTIELSAAANTQSMAAGDYLFLAGNRENSATPSRLMPCGFQGWLPSTAPSSGESFFEVDRSVDDRLGGLRWDCTKSGSLEDACLDMSSLIAANGGKTTHCVMGSQTYTKLVKSMRNRQYIDIETSEPTIGFKGVLIQGDSGDFAAYGDNAFEEGYIYLFDIEDVKLQHTGDDLIFIDQTDGLMFREVASTDDWQAKLVCSSQFSIGAPGHGCCGYNA